MAAQLGPSQKLELVPVPSRDKKASIIALLVASLTAAVPAFSIPAPELWPLAAMGIAGIVYLEPRAGLYLLCVIIGIDTAPLDPLTSPFSKLFASMPVVNLTPFEALAVWTALSAYIRGSLAGPVTIPPAFLLGSTGVFIAVILLGVLKGVTNGGDLTIALWEVRALVSVVPIMLATSILVRDRSDLRQLGLVVAIVLLLMTVETFWRYMVYVRPGAYEGALEFAFSHETSVFVGLLVVSSAAWALWGPNRKERLLAVTVCLLSAIVLMTMRRRAGLIAAESGLITVALFLFLKDKRRFMFIAPVALVLSIAYLGAFWNNPNSLGQPARAFRTVFDSSSTDGRDQSSDEYRRAENLNIWHNIRLEPLEGIGFGVPYAKPYPVPDLSAFWPFWDYIPHNTILWLWMKAGILGFLTFWIWLGLAMSRVVEVCKASDERLIVATGACIAAFITMVVLFSFVDLGLTNARLMAAFGIALGLIGPLQRLVGARLREQAAVGGLI